MVHEKNWRLNLCVQELYHPRDFLWILAVIPICQNLTGFTVLSWFHQVALNFAHCRWRRWGWMTLLSRRCLWNWWRSRGRTWQAWNHDGNEIFRIANCSNPVFNEMWLLTIGPFEGIPQNFPSDNTADVFSRIFIVKNIQFFDILCSLFMRLHFSIGGYDYRRTTRFRQNIHLSITQVIFADHVHWRSGVDNKFSFLKLKSWCRQAPVFRKREECCSFMLL